MTLLPLVVMLAPGVGIDSGAGVWDGEVDEARLDAVASTGVDWVRVNFRLDAWSSLDDPAWQAAFDRIVDGYVARGIQVYGLINDEAFDTTAIAADTPEYVDAFAAAAERIVAHFKDRVRVFELVNEPNDWAGGSEERLHAEWFARVLDATAARVKGAHPGDACWDVSLVSGPLFSFDGVAADDYLGWVYETGEAELGWGAGVPFDGVGYHVYVAQGSDSTVGDAGAEVSANLARLRAVIDAHDTPGKGIWISEYGWRADWVGDEEQAARLEAAYAAMREAGGVAAAFYFQVADFPGGPYGVYAEGGFDAAHRRVAADRLAAVAAANRPERAAHGHAVAAGDAVEVTIENRGATAWGPNVRLGAAAGCPDATVTNEVAWAPLDGYVNGPTDARAFLPAEVPPGGTITVRVPVRPTGRQRFAARMVDEGTAWFGTTIVAEVDESGGGGGGGAGGDDPAMPVAMGDGCGCRVGTRGPGGGVVLAILMLLLAVRTCGACRRAYKRDERFCPIDGAALVEGLPGVDPLIGETLGGRYLLQRAIGRGGMGAVYEAEHVSLGKRVAVKVLLDTYSEDREVLTRFHQEARTSSRIGHENIIDISDLGEHAGRSFIVMEYLPGRDLAALLQEEILLAPERALPILRQICAGLEAAHQKGIIHRDMKPENVFLTERGGRADFVKVMDFGISKIKAAHEQEVRLTQTGALIGTPLYMAPEQALGRPDLDHRVDVYAVGVMMFEMLGGRPPFQAPTYLGLLSQHLHEPPPRLRTVRPELPARLEQVISRALEKDPDRRWPSMAAMASALPEPGALPPTVVRPAPPRKKSRAWLLVTAGLLSGAAGAALLGTLARRQPLPTLTIPAPPKPAAVAIPVPVPESPPPPAELPVLTEKQVRKHRSAHPASASAPTPAPDPAPAPVPAPAPTPTAPSPSPATSDDHKPNPYAR